MLTSLALLASLTMPAQIQPQNPPVQSSPARPQQIGAQGRRSENLIPARSVSEGSYKPLLTQRAGTIKRAASQKPIFGRNGVFQYAPVKPPRATLQQQTQAAPEPGRFPLQQIPAPQSNAQIPPQRPIENLTRFDYRSAQIRWVNNRWQVRAGNVLLKDFGPNQRDARDAARLIQDLKLTERGTIGSPAPIMEYWLADGKAPQATTSRLRLKRIDQHSLRVDKIAGHWCVRDDRQIFFNFGVQKNDAEQAAELMRRHRFSQMGFIGYPQPAMMYFVAGGNRVRPQTMRSPGIQYKPIPKEDKTAKKKPGQQEQENPQPSRSDLNQQRLLQFQALQLARGTRQLSAPITGKTARWRFDPQRMAVRQHQNRWKLFADNLVLADFGSDYGRAKQSLQMLNQTRCNELCSIGQPAPSYSYFLANGQAPRGVRKQTGGTVLQPNRITIQQLGKHWCLCEGNQPLLSFGGRRQDAQEMANVIRRHRIDYLNSMADGVVFLARTR